MTRATRRDMQCCSRCSEPAGSVHLLGVDPGLDGGWALLEPQHGRNRATVVACGLLPRLRDDPRRLDLEALARTWRHVLPGALGTVVAAIEAVDASPMQGRSSGFAFGRAAGALEGLLMGLGLSPVHRVLPSVWKARMGLPGGRKGKPASVALAHRLTGETMIEHEAEAALIAWCVWITQPLATEAEGVLT